MTEATLTQDDLDYCVLLAGCSLAKTPEADNWVDHAGGLPEYICEIARAIKRSGKTTSQAISIAVSRVKKWAAGADNVNADTRAKAAKAVAEWEAKKAKSKAKKVAKLSNRTGLMEMTARPVEVIAFCGASFSMDKIRKAYDQKMREVRNKLPWSEREAIPWTYVQEVWNTHLIIGEDYNSDTLYKVDYTVDDNGDPTFGEPVKVVIEYVEAGKDISDNELESALA